MDFKKLDVPEDIKKMVMSGKHILPAGREDLIEISLGGKNRDCYEVGYEAGGKEKITEATVVRCKNGISVNYNDIYMRRRDPNCLVVGDKEETSKPRFNEEYGYDFDVLRKKTFKWLSKQDKIIMPFCTGREETKYESLYIGPGNAGFFALALYDLQNIMPAGQAEKGFRPKIIVYLAPPFRHSAFKGKQVVVHNRHENLYEVFAYNLYLGPSAKKGLYGALLHYGEKEGRLTLHSSFVKLETPYDNTLTILHEGASGGGKSEMNEHMEHSEKDTLILGRNIIDNRAIETDLFHECELFPATDDMTICKQAKGSKLTAMDAENAWFVRINHMTKYGTNPHFERMCIHSEIPLTFLNIDGIPGATCLPWEHTMDAPGEPCPNPRVIFPRRLVPGVVNEPMQIDFRSFGIRTPPCTKENPTYGILGYFHLLPPALAWLWRLSAPRGFDNPSIVESKGLQSEGIGTYGPFLTGSLIKHANLLLEQFEKYRDTQCVVFPNQYSGAWKVGFMPQWIIREYLARRGNRRFEKKKLTPAKSSLLGYIKKRVIVETITLPEYMLDVSTQPEVGEEAYFKGEKILRGFFDKELQKFDSSGLSGKGKKIIECFKDNGNVHDFEEILI